MIVSTIISAHNEEPRIASVLKVVSSSTIVDEIIVIDDGSIDNTGRVAKKFPKVKLIVNKKTIGKYHSLVKGIGLAKGSILLFLDADILNLTSTGVDDLVRPVVEKKVDMTMSYRGGDHFFSRYILPCSSFTSGERCLRKNDYYQIEGLKKAKALEFDMLSNRHFLKQKKKIGIVVLHKLQNVMKWKKIGFVRGWLGEIKATVDLIKVLGSFELLRQIFILGYLFQFKRLFLKRNLIFVN